MKQNGAGLYNFGYLTLRNRRNSWRPIFNLVTDSNAITELLASSEAKEMPPADCIQQSGSIIVVKLSE